MISALRNAASGMVAQQAALDVIGNNLANVNTPGFKRSRANFQDIVPGETGPEAAAQQAGAVNVRDVQRIDTVGAMEHTGNPLDIAINGPGFLPVTLADGTVGYTRNGSLRVDETGRIRDSMNNPLAANITLPAGTTSVAVRSDGTMMAAVDGRQQEIGAIQVAVFANPGGLEARGDSTFVATAASGDAILVVPGTDGSGELGSAVREMSNVPISDEMVNLIIAQRAYQASLKSVQTIDEMLQQANSLNA